PHLIRTPNRNAFALPQHLLDGPVEREVDPRFDTEVPRPDVEGRGHPADGMLLDRGSPRPIAPSHFDYRGPGVGVLRPLGRRLRAEYEKEVTLAGQGRDSGRLSR